MASKKKQGIELPDWATSLWEGMGSPDLSEFVDVHNGELLKRRHGLRRDDLVEILLDARSIVSDEETWLCGRLLPTKQYGFHHRGAGAEGARRHDRPNE
mgnify:CR=1 FL=1